MLPTELRQLIHVKHDGFLPGMNQASYCDNPLTVIVVGQVTLDFFQIFLNELPYYFRFNPLLNLSWELLIGHFVEDNGTI